MLHKTKVIVLNFLKYGDSSLVVTTYTQSHGRLAFLVQGVYNRKSKFAPTFFQPFNLLDLEIDFNPKRNLQRIKELRLAYTFQTLPFDNTKSAIALFLSEILYKTLKEEEANPPLFDFLFHSIQLFDLNEHGTANFHLVFLFNLAKYLGFYPTNNYSETNCIFDTVNGKFYPFMPSQEVVTDRNTSYWMHRLFSTGYDQLPSLELNHSIRNELIKLLIEFYSYHLGGLSTIKSLPVLQNVFEE